MRIIKKAVSIMLALLLSVGMATTTFADGYDDYVTTTEVVTQSSNYEDELQDDTDVVEEPQIVTNETNSDIESGCGSPDDPLYKRYNSPVPLAYAVSGASNLVHNSRFDGFTKSYGIDVSYWNTITSWSNVAASGVKFVIIRVGYRTRDDGDIVLDSNFAANIKGAKAAGLKVGVYFYSTAITTTEAKAEASFVLKQVSSYNLDLPIYFDDECTEGRSLDADLTVAQRTKNAIAFLSTIESAGYTAGYYSYLSWLWYNVDMSQIEDKYQVWIANITTETTYDGEYQAWQYLWTGAVSGITGAVDMDVLYTYDVPSAAKNLKVSTSGQKATLSWDKASNITGYKIYKKTSTGTASLVKTTTSTSYTFTMPETTAYYYYVKAYKTVDGSTNFGEASNSILLVQKMPTNLVVTDRTQTSISVAWDKVANASGYLVYASTNNGSSYTLMKTLQSTSCTLSGLTTSQKYRIKIKAYFNEDGSTAYNSSTSTRSIYSEIAYTGTKGLKAKNVTITANTTTSFKIAWTVPADKPEGYQVYYINSAGTYKWLGNTETNSFTATDMTAQQLYKIRIRPYYYNGDEKITAVYSDIAYASTQQVKDVTASSRSQSSITVSWTKLSGATGYKIYRMKSNAGSYSLIGTTTSTSFAMTSLPIATSYNFKILPYYTTTSNVGVYSEILYTGTKGYKVQNLRISYNMNYKQTISWDAPSGLVHGYSVFMVDNSTGKYVYLGSTEKTKYTVSDLKAGTQYSYVVRAYYMNNGIKVTAVYSSKLNCMTRYFKVKNLVCTDKTATSASLSWKAVSGATGYKVYKVSGSTYTLLADVGSNTTYTAYSMKKDTSYSYSVRAYKTIDGVSYHSWAADTLTVVGGLTAPTVTTKSYNSSSCTISWDAVSGASYYEVYTYNEANDVYSLKATVTTTQYKFTGLTKAKAYTAKVRAVYKNAYADSVDYEYACQLATPSGLNCSAKTTTTATLRWNSVIGATKYRIYKYNSSTNTYTKVADTTACSYKVTGLSAGNTYQYSVRAYITLPSRNFFSAYPDTLSVTTSKS